MLGTIVNASCIIAGSLIGSLARKAIKPQYRDALYNAMGLAALLLGISAFATNISKSEYPVLFIASLALGSLAGSMLKIADRFNAIVGRYSKSRLAEGLSTGILLYCIGTLSIVGSVMSALYADNTYLFTNAMLDLVTSAVLASTYGIGMILAAPVLFIFQGSIYLVTTLAGDVISESLMCEISIVGGVLIASSGLSILGIKDCKTLNMLPSLAVPVIFYIILSFIGGLS